MDKFLIKSTPAPAAAAAAADVANDTPSTPPAPASSSSTEAAAAAASSPASSPLSPSQKATIEAKKAAAMAKLAATKATAASRKRKSASEAAEEEEASAAAAAASSTDDASDPKRSKLAALTSLIPADWAKALAPEFKKSYWPEIEKFLKQQSTAKVQVFPPREQIFRALELCPFDQVKVVIIGQDPYHDDGQAEGLCFSVPMGIKVPSSLANIYKELGTDLAGFKKPTHGNLTKWAQQGILLLNTSLTVKAHEANSHKSIGWTQFTSAVISAVNKEKKNVVFLLWGKHAQDAGKAVDKKKHHVLMTVHPSGLSASRGFFGCKHFSKTNDFLKADGLTPINWQV